MRGKLEKKYANPDDGGYTYVADDGEKIPLTPALMSQWARAMVCVSCVGQIILEIIDIHPLV